MSRIRNLWDKLEAYLEKENPELLKRLHPPATETEVKELEKHLKIKLPSDFVESMKIHNGHRIWVMNPLLTDKEIIRKYNGWMDLMDDFDDEDDHARTKPDKGVSASWYNEKWFPIAGLDGDNVCIDYAPASGGTKCQIIAMWHDDTERKLLTKDFTSYLEGLVNITIKENRCKKEEEKEVKKEEKKPGWFDWLN